MSNSANKNMPLYDNRERSVNAPRSSENEAARSHKVRKIGNPEASIRIQISNPNINFKKTK